MKNWNKISSEAEDTASWSPVYFASAQGTTISMQNSVLTLSRSKSIENALNPHPSPLDHDTNPP